MLTAFYISGAFLGLHLPGQSLAGRVCSGLVNIGQLLNLVYVGTLAAKHSTGVATLVNNLLAGLQSVLPLAFLHWYTWSRAVRNVDGELNSRFRAQLAAGVSFAGHASFTATVIAAYILRAALIVGDANTYYKKDGVVSAFGMAAQECVLWAPALGGVAVCMLVAEPHLHFFKSAVTAANAAHPGDMPAALRAVKHDIDAARERLHLETRIPNFLFVLPMFLVIMLFIMDSLWVLYDFKSKGYFDDDFWPETENVFFFFVQALQLMLLSVSLVLPAALVNTAADTVERQLLSTFYGEPAASAAAHWVSNSRAGWKITFMRSTVGNIKAALTTLFTVGLITVSREM
jgi:hypothetical protein